MDENGIVLVTEQGRAGRRAPTHDGHYQSRQPTKGSNSHTPSGLGVVLAHTPTPTQCLIQGHQMLNVCYCCYLKWYFSLSFSLFSFFLFFFLFLFVATAAAAACYGGGNSDGSNGGGGKGQISLLPNHHDSGNVIQTKLYFGT